MTITFVAGSHTNAPNAGVNSLSVVVPASVQPGDVLVASAWGTAPYPVESGWRLEAFDPNAGPNGMYVRRVYSRVAGGSEPSAYTFEQAGPEPMDVDLFAYRGLREAYEVRLVASSQLQPSDAAGNIHSPGISNVVGEFVALHIFAQYGFVAQWTVPGGTTLRYSFVNNLSASESRAFFEEMYSGGGSSPSVATNVGEGNYGQFATYTLALSSPTTPIVMIV